MDIKMAGIDYRKASVEERELFSFTKSLMADALQYIKKEYPQIGCVILSTCNRTEIWIHGEGISPMELLCKVKGLDSQQYQKFFICREDQEAVHYLMELACGLQSQIFGEDQILAQVKDAIAFARMYQSADTVLEILFRDVVTAAKRVKSSLRLTTMNNSMAVSTIQLLKETYGTLKGKKCMVIGNGEMGRLAAEALLKEGCHVMMTLRQYKSREAVIPAGCEVINYEERMHDVPLMDIVLSATLSPHYTLKKEEMDQVRLEHLITIVDLAVPRDVDPQLKGCPMLTVYDVDDLGGTLREEDIKQVEKAQELLAEYETEFEKWYDFRKWIPLVKHIVAETGEEISWRLQKQVKAINLTESDAEILSASVEESAEKSVAKLLYGLRDYLDKGQLECCMNALKQVVDQR